MFNSEVIMVGIHGIGDIDKTTHKGIYNLIAGQFEGCCFLENVREKRKKHGLEHLQEVVISKLLGINDIKLESVSEGISVLQRLRQKKVLLILDDVDEPKQLRAIVGAVNWFGSGNRVIITTRDKHLLESHEIQRRYEVHGLSEKDALLLLSWNAFKCENINPIYMDILKEAVTYTCGLPLALEVIGSNLFGKSIRKWKFTLDRYKKIPQRDIQKILKISFDGLEEFQKKLFLDIVCCFHGCRWSKIIRKLDACYDVPLEYDINMLVQKSLLKIGYVNFFKCVMVHDLIRDMGRETVYEQSQEYPGKCSRLWIPKIIVQVLEDDSFLNMKVLRLDCSDIFEIPDVSSVPNLENLSFQYCKNLIQVHQSVGFLNKLSYMGVWGCSKLKTFPALKLPRLKGLDFSRCSSLENFPEILGCNMLDESVAMILPLFRNVETLNLSENSFTFLPESIKELRSLRKLYLNDCKKLEEIREIPPNIELLSAINCMFLSPSSRSMLLDKELHSSGRKRFVLPGSSIPKWLEDRGKSKSITFWFRNMLPTFSLLCVGGNVKIWISINGRSPSKEISWLYGWIFSHTIIIDIDLSLENEDGFLSKSEWNHVEISIHNFKSFGTHMHNKDNNMKDIRFTKPQEEKWLLLGSSMEIDVDEGFHSIRLMQTSCSSTVQGSCHDNLYSLKLNLDYEIMKPSYLISSNGNSNSDSDEDKDFATPEIFVHVESDPLELIHKFPRCSAMILTEIPN